MPKNLLIADDSLTIRKVIGMIFATEDFQVTAVDNGLDAISRARELRPDIVLADVMMPGKSGYEVCEALKSDPATQGIPVLLLAGTFEAFDENRARSAGANDHVSKPFESQVLLDKVRTLVGQPTGVSASVPQPVAQAPVAQRPMAAAGIPGAPTAAPGARPGMGLQQPPPSQQPGMAARPGVPGVPPPGMARPGVPGVPPPGMARPGVPGVPPPGMARPGVPGMAPPGMARPGVPPPGMARPMGVPGAPPPGMARPGIPQAGGTALPGGFPRAPGAAPLPAAAMGAPGAAPRARDPFGLTGAHGGIAAAPQAQRHAPANNMLSFDDVSPGMPSQPQQVQQRQAPAAHDGGEALLRDALSKASRDVIEKIAWEVVPQLAETIIREELERLIKDRETKH